MEYCPNSIILLNILGASIRLDTTLVDFTEMRWERGDITFLYRGDAPSPEESLYVLDNELKVYQKVREIEYPSNIHHLSGKCIKH